jgi:uncharacterized protein with HEPN domain
MRRDALLLVEIIDSIERILQITASSPASEIEAAPDRRDSLLWNFTVLGEASNQVSAELKAQHPEVPWADAARTRNRIVHGYWSIDLDVLAAIASDDLPAFLAAVRSVFDSLGEVE